MSDWLNPLRRVLDRSTQPARFFFCDDNVGGDHVVLRRMLDLFAAHQVPIDLGLTRELLDGNLAEQLRARLTSSNGRVGLHRHGFSGIRRAEPLSTAQNMRTNVHALRRRGSVAYRVRADFHSAAESADAEVSATVTPGSSQIPISVDWCSHRLGDAEVTREHLGRLIAVAATRGQPVGVILDHTRMGTGDLQALAQLILLLTNHRRVECLRMRELAGPSSADAQSTTPAADPNSQGHQVGTDSLLRRAISSLLGLGSRFSLSGAKLWWVLAVCLVAVGVLCWRWLGEGTGGTRYLTAPVVRGDIENTVLSAGTLQPYEFVDVGAQTSGQLKSLKVKLGDRVEKGQLLAEIDPVISASKVAEAEATLAGLKAQWTGKKEQLELAARQRARSQELQKHGAQADSDAEVAESNYKQARDALEALGAEMKQARAVLETARANLEYTRITAPMAGEVVSIIAREGQTLNASQQAPTLLRIATLDTMTVWALVPEADVSHLRLGQDVYFTLLGQDEHRWHSRLRQILPSPEIVANVVFYDALFDVPNPQRDLKVQMTAQVSFVLDQAKNALYVPATALSASKNGHAVVRRLDASGRAEKRRVEVGITNAVSAQILGGLNEGDTVVVGEADPKSKDKARPTRPPGPR